MFSLTDYEWLSTGQIVSLRERSYAHGPSDTPLLGETIGENLRRTVERFAEREALIVPHQGYRATYEELWEQADSAARAFIAHGVDKGDRIAIWAPNRYEWVVTQFAAARIGAILVAIDPTSKPAELAYALNKAGVSVLVMARAFRAADYVGMLDDVRSSCHSLRETIVLEEDWETFLADAEYASDGAAGRPRGEPPVRRPDHDPVHVGHDGLPEGRDALAPQHPQQRVLHRAGALLQRGGPRVRAGAVLRLVRHGRRHPRERHARRLRRGARRVVRRTSGAGGSRGGALHLALRRADDVHRRARAARSRAASISPVCAPA